MDYLTSWADEPQDPYVALDVPFFVEFALSDDPNALVTWIRRVEDWSAADPASGVVEAWSSSSDGMSRAIPLTAEFISRCKTIGSTAPWPSSMDSPCGGRRCEGACEHDLRLRPCGGWAFPEPTRLPRYRYHHRVTLCLDIDADLGRIDQIRWIGDSVGDNTDEARFGRQGGNGSWQQIEPSDRLMELVDQGEWPSVTHANGRVGGPCGADRCVRDCGTRGRIRCGGYGVLVDPDLATRAATGGWSRPGPGQIRYAAN